MTDAALDRPSLTLPDWRSALKRRIRRPRRPNPWQWPFLAFAGFFFWFAAGSAHGEALNAAVYLGIATGYVIHAWRIGCGRASLALPRFLFVLSLIPLLRGGL